MVPPVPPGSAGVAWLRATVARFSSGTVRQRRRALAVALLDAIPLESLRASNRKHPVEIRRDTSIQQTVTAPPWHSEQALLI
jgi:hypothetical protein